VTGARVLPTRTPDWGVEDDAPTLGTDRFSRSVDLTTAADDVEPRRPPRELHMRSSGPESPFADEHQGYLSYVREPQFVPAREGRSEAGRLWMHRR